MTSAAVAVGTSGTRVIYDGQSLPQIPTGNNFPIQLMSGSFPKVPYKNICIGGASFAQSTKTRLYRVDPWAASSSYTVYVLCQGTTDLAFDATAAQVYAAMWDATDYARSVGYDYVIVTTITPDTGFTGAQETQRVAANALIVADASAKFDAVADFAAAPELSDASNGTYFTGGLHYTAAGAGIAAAVLQPKLAVPLAAHP